MKKINKNKLTIRQESNKNSLEKRRGFLLFEILGLFLIFGLAFQVFLVKADDAEDLLEKKEKYQEELKDLEKDAEKVETELSQVNQEISKTQSVIYSTSQTIEQFEETIEGKEKEIKSKEDNIKFKRQVLSEYLRLFRRNNLEIGLAIYDVKQDLGKFLRERENYEDFQAKIEEALNTIRKEKEAVEEAKEKIEEKKEEKEEVLEEQQKERQNLVYLENQKKNILAQTHLSIAEVKSKMANLNRKLNAFLDEDFDLDKLIKVIKKAEKETGVRKEFLFAMLDKESDLGRFTGGCTYKTTRVKDSDKEVFKKICEELGYNYKKQKISCASSSGGYGGAMGLAQFMPTTWAGWDGNGGYAPLVAKKTGNNPPNPWRLEDGVMGMAIKLEAAGADSKKREHSAAMIYYCGSDNPKETYPGRIASCNNYADTVTAWSEGYDDYFD